MHPTFSFLNSTLVRSLSYLLPAKMADSQDPKNKSRVEDVTDDNAQDSPAVDDAENTTTIEGSSESKEKKPLAKIMKEKLSRSSNEEKTVTPQMLETLLSMNPALAGELAHMPHDKAVETLGKMDVADLLTGLSLGKKNAKDMASYKFWQTQPVPRFDDQENLAEGPIKIINPEQVSKEPPSLVEGFEWVTLDVEDDKEVAELYELLSNHYVEDDNAMFRFNYSRAFLNWCVWRVPW